ncbi:hypothetical protein BD779DRAFT_1029333 [Infundibulicybe gibba]|nr:hypothetical protein BD779DRAFT_1029333 [Infundibulicybe gibba]
MFLSDIDHDTLQKVVPLSGSPLVLSSLQTLNLRFSTSNHHSHFLAALRLPRLRECKVSCSYGLPWSLSVLRLFLEPSSHTLEDLTLTDLLLGGEYMDEILILLPRLTRLCLFGTTTPPPAALGRLSEGVVGSRLTELSIGHIRLGPLFDMLEGRLAAARASDGGVTAFETVSACCDSTDDAEDGRFGALRAAGMRVDITSWY